MTHTPLNRILFAIQLLVLCSLNFSGCKDDEDGLSVDCSDLGTMLTESATMSGTFDFGSGGRFPLSVDLDVSSMSFEGQTSFNDASQHFEGTCTGTMDTSGALTGHCLFVGDFELDVDFNGRVGINGGCGTWVNEADQAGQWQVAP